MAQRRRGEAGRERVVDVDDVEARPPPSSPSSARLTSSGSGAARGRGPRGIGMPLPSASTGGPPSPPARSRVQLPSKSAAGRSPAAAIARRDSRSARRESDGAATTTRWPRSASSAETRATNSLISWRAPQGCGVTWAIERRSPSHAPQHRRRAGRAARLGLSLSSPRLGALAALGVRACSAMNSSVSSRASSSGRWVCGDFIR